jgi:cytidine deaminase
VTATDADLVAAAAAARDRSYAPYSDFHMGAAVRCADGTVVPGALVENVSLGLAMCAERSALFATVAQGLAPVALALVSKRTSGQLTFPCGACMQVALELAGPELVIVAADPDGASETARLGDLLPRAPRRNTYAPAG